MVPHITDAIQEWVMKQARVSVDDDDVEPEVCVIEVSHKTKLHLSKISFFTVVFWGGVTELLFFTCYEGFVFK